MIGVASRSPPVRGKGNAHLSSSQLLVAGPSPFRPEIADSGRVWKEATVPPRGLPGNANLEQRKNGAKSFQRAVRSGDAGAAEVVREFHPRLGQAQPGSPELATFKRANAQLVVARSFGFPSWAKLKAYVEFTPRYSRAPHAQPIGEPIRDQQELVDEFLRLACLTYGRDDPSRWGKARELLAAHPELATAPKLHSPAATLLAECGADPERVRDQITRTLLQQAPELAGRLRRKRLGSTRFIGM